MSYIDTKYLNFISPQLQMFKKKGDNLWNFRCPYCGDSQKSKTKARGFVFRKKNDLFFKCHNCDTGASLSNLIKYVDSNLHNDYIMERYKKGVQTTAPSPEFKFNAPVFRKKSVLKCLQSIQELSPNHPARGIVEQRKIPPKCFNELYLCKSFYKFTNSLIPNKFPSLDGDHPRLLIPFRDEKGEVFAYQGRAFGNEQPKYITIKLDDDKDKIFGLDKVIYDNEPRNREINKQIEKTIEQGRNVCLWPDSMKHKDINDMIIAGYSKEKIEEIIVDNTFYGVAAKLRFVEWKKINERSVERTV